MSKLQLCAASYLRMLANDIAGGAPIWPAVHAVERRFRLAGFTGRLLDRCAAQAAEFRRRIREKHIAPCGCCYRHH
jgi:hypothetical protein